ncbi:hypothetical protein [Hyphomicrobium sp. D-2]|uniref:hypothetical protein n=1 Tax=Hyphomicrobium sp. D-2 TaxID=3041621 RepID=UPI002458D610|nr:hypothetical protein [Hyphomicrobium sp. D-2]MDH4981359.1 hypothetical protein [Hyphomicrobium sp. D-2]
MGLITAERPQSRSGLVTSSGDPLESGGMLVKPGEEGFTQISLSWRTRASWSPPPTISSTGRALAR